MAWKKSGLILIILIFGFIALKLLSNISSLETPNLTPESFPEKFNGWIGKDVPVSPEEKSFLPKDTLFMKRYFSKPEVGEVYLVVVFSGKDRRSIHRPEVCYPSQGWSISNKRIHSVNVDHPIKSLKTTSLEVSFRKSKTARTDLVLYWFMGNNRITASHYKRVFLMGLDRCVYGRNYRWAFLRLSVPFIKNREQAFAVADEFIKDLFPHIADNSYSQF
ncbi:EpsI family protein [bacterium]|nr:EpsI family protein [bacterium]